MKASEQVLAALDYMREHGHNKGFYRPLGGYPGEGPPGSVCIQGAFMDTVGLDAAGQAEHAVRDACRDLFLARCGGASIVDFNDHPDTTFSDVELVMKHAAYDLESRGL